MEVASFMQADQFQPAKSEFECGFFAVMMCLSMAPCGHLPTLSAAEVISRAETAYETYDGSTSSDNTAGMTLEQEYALLKEVGLHYQATETTTAACLSWLAVGYPVLVAVAEASVYDEDLGHNPYPWTPSGNHIIVLSGESNGNYLVRDSANCTDLFDPGSLRPGPRTYSSHALLLVSATVVVPPWMERPTTALPQGETKMTDTTNQMIVDLYNSMEKYFVAIYGTLPARDSGIFKSAYGPERLAGRFRGIPLTPEYDTVDTRGVAVRAQNWSGGICHWYPKTSVAVWM